MIWNGQAGLKTGCAWKSREVSALLPAFILALDRGWFKPERRLIFLVKIIIFVIICQVKKSIVKEFGATIRELREHKDLLLRQVAAELDIDTALLSKVERGERYIRKEQVVRIATIIGADKKDLLVLWLAAKIDDVIKDEDYASEALSIVVKKRKKEK